MIGVAGGTGSGKSTVARRLADALGPDEVAVITLDAYYHDESALALERRAEVNYDHPAALDWPLLLSHLEALRRGAPIQVPRYDFSAHVREEGRRHVVPTPLIVVEGILALHDPRLRQQFDLKVFVHTEADVRFIRRLRRDVAERGRSAEQVIEQYLATVRDAHDEFVEPTKIHADLVVTEGGQNDAAFEQLLGMIVQLEGAAPASGR